MSRNTNYEGLVKKGHIEAIEGLWEGLDFTFRPLSTARAAAFFRESFTSLPDEKQLNDQTSAIVDSLKSWSEVDEKDQPLPINQITVKTLPLFMIRRLVNIVCLNSPTDKSGDDLKN